MGLVLHIRCKRTESKLRKIKPKNGCTQPRRRDQGKTEETNFLKKEQKKTPVEYERESERTNLEGIEMDPGISANTILLGGPFSSLLASPACNKAS